MNIGAIAVAVAALFHFAFFNRVIRHAADAMGYQFFVGVAFDLVTADAFKVLAAGIGCTHVYVVFERRVGQRHREIAVLDVIAATGIGVAEDAVVDRRAALADALCNRLQVHTCLRPSRRLLRLGIGAGLIVAYEAVDIVAVAEIECVVRVAVTDMTLRATTLVARDRDTEVIDDVFLAVVTAFESFDIRRDAFPLEVPGVYDFIADSAMTTHAGLGAFIRSLGKIAAVQSRWFVGIRKRGSAAVEYVDDAITVDVFIGQVGDAVLVEIPAGNSVGAGRTDAVSAVSAVSAGCPWCPVITLAARQSKTDHQDEQCEHRW